MDMVRVAVVQAASVRGDTGATLKKARDLLGEASIERTSLAVFPEAFIGGYPRGATFGATIGHRSPEGREAFREYWESAIEVPGPEIAQLGDYAARFGIHLVIGVIERDGGTLYCSAVFIDGSGHYLGKHRKLMPTGTERLIWGCGDGSTLKVFSTDIGRIGAVICWENYMPLLRAAMYAKGIQIYCAPTADARDTWISTMRHVACEGRCFVLGANQYTAGQLSDNEHTDNPIDGSDISCRGGSVIVSPLGEVIAGPCFDREAVLTAELDMREIARGKFDFDVVGHYSRPDVFHLVVDERPQVAVSIIDEFGPGPNLTGGECGG